VADNGNFFSISAVPDDRWTAGEFSHLSSISITNFEVIQTTGPTEGPRSAGAPKAHAGSDLVGAPNVPIQLSASVSNALPVSIRWILYSGPGTVLFDNSKPLTNTTVTFGAPGNYVLMLAADDGVHSVAYDTLHATIANQLTATISRVGADANLTWTGSGPTFVVEQSLALGAVPWMPVLTTSVRTATVALTNQTSFFRIREQ
jgi:hypothetical protein